MTADRIRTATPVQTADRAAWQNIAHTLMEEINNRRFAHDARLPSESELTSRFGATRHSVRQALTHLESQRFIRIEPGRGSFVKKTLLDYTLSRRTRFTQNLLRLGMLPGKQLLTACETQATQQVASQLQLKPGEAVLMVEAVYEADDEPISLTNAYYPAMRFAGLLEMLRDNVSNSEILRTLGVQDYVRVHSRITTQMPTPEQARLLKQAADRPVLCVENVDADMQGVPIKYGETWFCGDRVQLVVAMEDTV